MDQAGANALCEDAILQDWVESAETDKETSAQGISLFDSTLYKVVLMFLVFGTHCSDWKCCYYS